MTEKPRNEPAFPCTNTFGDVFEVMSLRDWFAGQALAGLASATEYPWRWQPNSISASKQAYAYADAMLLERVRGGSNA